MTARLLAACCFLALSVPASAATRGLVLVEQRANADMDRAAASAEFELAQSLAYTTEFVGDTYYQVALFPNGTDLSGAATAVDIGEWVEETIRERKLRAVVVTIEPDGDAQNMKVHVDGKIDLGASGTMGTVYGLARKGDRLSGHYVYFGDLFGNPLVIDATFDEPLWKAPEGTRLPAGGGAPGKVYLELIDAGRRGDGKAFIERSAQAGTLEEWEEVKPMIQAMMPQKAEVSGGRSFPGRAILDVKGTMGGKPYAATAVMIERDGRWLMESSTTTNAEAAGAPPAIAGAKPDVLPPLAKSGVHGTPVTLLGQPFTARHGIAVRRPGSDEFVPQVLVLLTETPLAVKKANALWADGVALDQLFGKHSTRSMLFLYNEQEDGSLVAAKGFEISDAGEFNEAFALNAELQRFGSRLVGQYVAQRTDPETGESTPEGAVRFVLPIIEATD